jgi:hypothetical protein
MSNLESKLELGLTAAIIVVVGFVLFQPKDIQEDTKPTMESFYDFPLQAWMDTDKGGDVVKVRYLVDRMKTKLYMVDRYGVIVHKQPISLSPYGDGRERIETYVWKLYRTEWTDRIGAGEYAIIVGTDFDQRGTTIEIDIP